ncbi:hypothetical protein MN186_10735 [Aliiroseovarius sp. N1F302]|uniref:hypothetical protein n=1 Tax=Aliiroseovarius sediminis TaxID=2925839 RepID=UPI001F5900F6|nr:hypothetical protein [Aliiroseovarius sediminis]MCI2394934.1 hypothetical protein [Aliiroseovarius sediminis]
MTSDPAMCATGLQITCYSIRAKLTPSSLFVIDEIRKDPEADKGTIAQPRPGLPAVQ